MQFSTDYDAAQRLAFAKHPDHCKRDTPAHELAPTWHNIRFAGSILTIGLRRGKNNPPPNPHLSDILSKYQHRVFGVVPRGFGGRLGGGRNSCPRRSSSAARSRRSIRDEERLPAPCALCGVTRRSNLILDPAAGGAVPLSYVIARSDCSATKQSPPLFKTFITCR